MQVTRPTWLATCPFWGSCVRVLGIVGRDDQGGELLRRLEEESVDTSGVQRRDGYQTPIKARVLAASYTAPEAMYLANAASGVVVLEHGAAVGTIGTLRTALADASTPVTLPNSELR